MGRTISGVTRPGGPSVFRETLQLRSSRIDVDERDGYLHIVATGQVETLDDVAECNAEFERLMRELGIRRALLDARGQIGEPTAEVRAAVWEWFKSDRSFAVVGYVVPEAQAMKAARINMTAVALGMNLRAFVSVVEAHRFLAPKRASSLMAAVRETPESTPPAERPPSDPSPPRTSSFPPALAHGTKEARSPLGLRSRIPTGSALAEGESESDAARQSVHPRPNRRQ
jgi:hypothetical protein